MGSTTDERAGALEASASASMNAVEEPPRALQLCLTAIGGVLAIVTGSFLGGIMNLSGEGAQVPTHAADLMLSASLLIAIPSAIVMLFRPRLGGVIALLAIPLGLVGIATDGVLHGRGEVVLWWLYPSAFLIAGAVVAGWRGRRGYRRSASPRCGRLVVVFVVVPASLAFALSMAAWAIGPGDSMEAGRRVTTNWLSGVALAWAVAGALMFASAGLVRWRFAIGASLAVAAVALGFVAPLAWAGPYVDGGRQRGLVELWLLVAVPLLGALAIGLQRVVGGQPPDA